MTFDDVRVAALKWPEVTEGTSYGTPALKVRGKLLTRLKEDGESLVVQGIEHDERAMLIETQPKVFYSPTIIATGRSCWCGCRKHGGRPSKDCCCGAGARLHRKKPSRRLKQNPEATLRNTRSNARRSQPRSRSKSTPRPWRARPTAAASAAVNPLLSAR